MVSVVMAVHRLDKYLDDAILSILNQTFTDFELILVNDGSTDDTGAVCDLYAKKDHRIRVFHKENGGVSAARNLGIEK